VSAPLTQRTNIGDDVPLEQRSRVTLAEARELSPRLRNIAKAGHDRAAGIGARPDGFFSSRRCLQSDPAAKAARSASMSVAGKWRIVEMTGFAADYPDLVEPAYILFEKQGGGGVRLRRLHRAYLGSQQH
jgi:hypothetical protein